MQPRSYIIWICLLALGVTTSLAFAQDAPAVPAGGTTVAPATDETPHEITAPGNEEGKKTEATTTQPAGNEKTEEKKKEDDPKSFFEQYFLFIILGVFILFIFLSGRGRRKQEAKKREMLSALKKGDKVTSIGGIIGTIVEVRDNEIVVKVDENSNTRMRFVRDAIRISGTTSSKDESPENK